MLCGFTCRAFVGSSGKSYPLGLPPTMTGPKSGLGYGSWITARSRCIPIVPGGPRLSLVEPQPVTSKASTTIAEPVIKDWNLNALDICGLWQMSVWRQEQFCWQVVRACINFGADAITVGTLARMQSQAGSLCHPSYLRDRI